MRQSLKRTPLLALAPLFVLCALAVGIGVGHAPRVSAAPGARGATHRVVSPRQFQRFRRNASPITHVVVVVMENRSVDNLFQKFPGADTVGTGLAPQALMATDDPDHSYKPGFQTDFAGLWPAKTLFYVDPTKNYVGSVYYGLASKWVLADEMFQANEGPSFPAHQYLIAGQSGGINNYSSPFNLAPWSMAENPGKGHTPNCSNTNHIEKYVDMKVPYPAPEHTIGPPCNDYETILDLATAAFPSSPPAWRYYIAGTVSIWNAPDAVHHLYPTPPTQLVKDVTGRAFYNDVQQRNLSPLSYVIPCGSWSDHPTDVPALNTQEVGPNFVNFIVNTIGHSPYWANTTILVTWDDWGGWYDHVQPTHAPNAYGSLNDPYEYGFRVPLLIVSGWLKNPGVVDHTGKGTPLLRTHAAILRYIESVFGLPSLGTADGPTLTDDLQGAFNYARPTPMPFATVPGPTPFPAATASDCRHAGAVD